MQPAKDDTNRSTPHRKCECEGAWLNSKTYTIHRHVAVLPPTGKGVDSNSPRSKKMPERSSMDEPCRGEGQEVCASEDLVSSFMDLVHVVISNPLSKELLWWFTIRGPDGDLSTLLFQYSRSLHENAFQLLSPLMSKRIMLPWTWAGSYDECHEQSTQSS